MMERLNAKVLDLMLFAPERALDRLKRQEGQAFVEYTLVLVLIGVAVALITQWDTLRTAIGDAIKRVTDTIGGAGTSTP